MSHSLSFVLPSITILLPPTHKHQFVPHPLSNSFTQSNSFSSLFHCIFLSDMPVVTLRMGPSLNPDDIKEGDGVYFECTVRSNPKPYKMAWYHDVSNSFFFICRSNINTYTDTDTYIHFRPIQWGESLPTKNIN